MLRKYRKRVCSALLAILALLACAAPALAAGEEPDTPTVLTVAFPEAMGLNETYEDGTHGGCVYDWLHEIAKYTDWEYEFVTGDADELLNNMMAGEYDLMGGMLYYEGLEELFNYPEYVMGANYNLLIYHQEDESIRNFDYTTLNGKSIGVLRKAASKIARLEKFLDFNNIDCELVYYEDVETYEACLEAGEVDLLYGSDVYMRDGYNVAAMIEGDPYYLVTAADEPELCDELSWAMGMIYSANADFATELYTKYFPSKYRNSLSFTPEEQAFIDASSPIRVAVMADQYPVYYKVDGVTKGIVPACLELVEARTGLSFTFVPASTYADMFELLEQGKADIIGCCMEEESTTDARGLIQTPSFATLDSVILRNKQSDLSQEGRVMAAPVGRGSATLNFAYTVKYFDSYASCVEAVNQGEADFAEMPAAFVEDYYSRDYYANIILAADTGSTDKMTLALAKPVDVALYSILNKAINNLSDEELSGISAQSILAERGSTVTFRSLFYTNPSLVLTVCIGFVILMAAIALLIIRNKMKSRVMRMRLEEIQRTSRAKSDFLSRMSHEIRTPMNAIIGLTNLALMTDEATPAIKEDLDKIESSAQFLLSLLNDVLDMSKIENEKLDLEPAPFDLSAVTARLQPLFALQLQEKKINLIFDGELNDKLYVGDEMRITQILTNLLSNSCKFTPEGGIVTLTIDEQGLHEELAELRFQVKDNGTGIQKEDMERIFQSFEQAGPRNQKTPGTGLGLSICKSLVQMMGGELRVESKVGKGSVIFFTLQLPVYHGVLEPQQTETKIDQPVSLEGLHILLAEDNDINAEIAIELLAMQGVRVDRAADGQQAVDMFSGHTEGYYDVILMDVNMPIKDGLTATEEIRAMDRGDAQSIPILAMTANTFQEDRDQAMEVGMNGFLPKPFDVAQLYQILRDSIRQKAP